MVRPVRWLAGVLVAAALLGASVHAEPAFTPHSAEYKVRILVFGGRLNTRLEATEDGFTAHHVIKPTGLTRLLANGTIDEYSEFRIDESGVLPSFYRSHDQVTKDKTHAEFRFDWDTFEAIGTLNGEEASLMMGDLAHDRVTIQYQLMRDLMRQEMNDSYQLFDMDEMKTLNITTIGEKEVKVGAGKFNAIGVQHQTEGSSRVTTLWCVEELDYLPVVIEQHRDGKLRLRATLNEYAPIG